MTPLAPRDFIIDLIKKHNIKTYIEVGCWDGTLLRRVKDLGVKVIGIDPLSQKFNEFDKYTCRMGSEQAIPQEKLDEIANSLKEEFGDSFLRMTSEEAAKLPLTAELVYIDAIHDYEHIKEDIRLWNPKASKIICGDDYKTRFEGLKRGVDEVLPERQLQGVVWYLFK